MLTLQTTIITATIANTTNTTIKITTIITTTITTAVVTINILILFQQLIAILELISNLTNTKNHRIIKFSTNFCFTNHMLLNKALTNIKNCSTRTFYTEIVHKYA